MSVINCCKGCVPPKRNPHCHGTCPEYLAEKAAYEELRTEANRKKFLDFDLNAQREKAVQTARKRRRHN